MLMTIIMTMMIMTIRVDNDDDNNEDEVAGLMVKANIYAIGGPRFILLFTISVNPAVNGYLA